LAQMYLEASYHFNNSDIRESDLFDWACSQIEGCHASMAEQSGQTLNALVFDGHSNAAKTIRNHIRITNAAFGPGAEGTAQALLGKIARVADPDGLGTLVQPMRVFCCAPHAAAAVCTVRGLYAGTPHLDGALSRVISEIKAKCNEGGAADRKILEIYAHRDFASAMTAAGVVLASCVRSAVYADPRAIEIAKQQLNDTTFAIAEDVLNHPC